MRFSIKTLDREPDVAFLEAALRCADPAATVDLDAHGDELRLSTTLDGPEVLRVFGAAGYRVSSSDLVRRPSDCCGGCSG